MTQRIVMAGSIARAAIAQIVGVATFGDVSADARLIVGIAIVMSASAASPTSWWAARGRFGWATGASVFSVVAPTYSLWVINAVPIVLAAVAITALT